MNQYSIWRYLMILSIIVVGIVYALPNLYGEDPALQITSSRGFELPSDIIANIDDALVVEQISYTSRERQGNHLLYRFASPEDQLKAAGILRESLGDKFVVVSGPLQLDENINTATIAHLYMEKLFKIRRNL